MQVRIVDTTLRDGEQAAGIALGIEEKVSIARLLNDLEIYQIEAGTPAMGGDEKKSIEKMTSLGLKSKISAWNRMRTEDIRHSLDCGVDIIHIAVPASDIQISTKLNKDREWVIENLKRSVYYAISQGAHVTVGLEDASRADVRFLLRIMAVAMLEGVKRVRYADTVGILHRQRAFNEIQRLREELSMEIEMHTHNDLGMAVANSIWAAKAGAEYIDCTIGGVGERAGNCDYLQFIEAAKFYLGRFKSLNTQKILSTQVKIMNIIRAR